MAQGMGMSGRRRTQLLDAAISMLSAAGYDTAAAQKILDFREAEWDLGEEQAVMNAVSVGHFAAFVRDCALPGRLPLAVRASGEIGLDWSDGARQLALTFCEDGDIAFSANGPDGVASVLGRTVANGLDEALAGVGGWKWVRVIVSG